MLGGRLTINIISSRPAWRDPGQRAALCAHGRGDADPEDRSRRPALDHDGEFYKLKLAPPRIRTVSGRCPPLYFGGLSPDAREAAAKAADVYLMWPDQMPAVQEIIADMTARAANHGRKLKFGYRVHVVVRETESEAPRLRTASLAPG